MKSKKSKLIKIISIVLGALLVIYLGISVYGTRTGMVIPRRPLIYSADSLGLTYEDVSFRSRGDNVLLKGWYLPGQKNEVIIIVHGGFQNRIDDNVDTPGLARGLVKAGYSVLLYDLRGRGESEGEGRSLQNIDQDIGGAVDYLESRGFSNGEICIMGFCTGAASTCIYASRNSDVGALVLDGCFVDVHTVIARQAEELGAPVFLAYFLWPGGVFFSRVLYGYKVVNPIDVIPAVDCPILFIHEEYDLYVNSEETRRLYKSTVNPANEIFEVSGAQHSQGFRTKPQEYIEKVDEFLSKIAGQMPSD